MVATKPDITSMYEKFSGLSPGLAVPSAKVLKEPKTSYSLISRLVPDFDYRECPIGLGDHLSWSSSPVKSSVQALGNLFCDCSTWARLYDIGKLMSCYLAWFRLIQRSVAFPGVPWNYSPSAKLWTLSWVRELGDWDRRSVEGGLMDKSMFPHPSAIESTMTLEHLVYLNKSTYPMSDDLLSSLHPVGRLGLKYEAAGKVPGVCYGGRSTTESPSTDS